MILDRSRSKYLEVEGGILIYIGPFWCILVYIYIWHGSGGCRGTSNHIYQSEGFPARDIWSLGVLLGGAG